MQNREHMNYDNFDEGYVPTSLGSIYYRHHAGSKKRIIFLHGLGANTKTWAKLVARMPDDFDVYLIDLLGHGNSDAPRIEYRITTQTQALREFVSAVKYFNFSLFGNSYGGWIAAHYASQGYQLDGLVLEDAAGLREYLDDILKSGNPEEYKARLIKGVMELNGNRDYVIKSIVDSEFDSALDSDTLSAIRVKTLVLWGENDSIIDLKYGKLLHEKIPGSELVVIKGAGHTPHYSAPSEVSRELCTFIGSEC